LQVILALFVLVQRLCGVVDAIASGTVLLSTYKVLVSSHLFDAFYLKLVLQDWPRHRHECQAVSPTGMAPTTVESESSTVEAILFNPSEGM
jgi:hypothetical protein